MDGALLRGNGGNDAFADPTNTLRCCCCGNLGTRGKGAVLLLRLPTLPPPDWWLLLLLLTLPNEFDLLLPCPNVLREAIEGAVLLLFCCILPRASTVLLPSPLLFIFIEESDQRFVIPELLLALF